MVAEGMAQRIGASGRQTVLAVFVGSGMAFAVGMGFQTTCGIVAEGFFAAVGIAGEGEVLVGVVMVFGVLSQRIGNTRPIQKLPILSDLDKKLRKDPDNGWSGL